LSISCNQTSWAFAGGKRIYRQEFGGAVGVGARGNGSSATPGSVSADNIG
jgi:hypothetical protein